MLLSQSAVVLPSSGSTFGYWAGFLCDGPLILHPDHIHAPLRPADCNARFHEGPPLLNGECPPLLRTNLLALPQD
jgi:hypothetical protein